MTRSPLHIAFFLLITYFVCVCVYILYTLFYNKQHSYTSSARNISTKTIDPIKKSNNITINKTHINTHKKDINNTNTNTNTNTNKPQRIPAIVIEEESDYIPSSDSDNGMQFPTERLCRTIIEQYFRAPFPKLKKLARVKRTQGFLELDGYNKDLNIAFEYQGEQHYHYPHRYWKSKEEYKAQKVRDRAKLRLCKLSGIDLIVIPYTIKKKHNGGIEKVLEDYLLDKYPDRGISRLKKNI